MKINAIEIQNYKSLKNFKADKFKNINLLFGYNNSGKSNFLQFLHLIFKKKAGGEIVTVNTGVNIFEEISRYEDGVKDFYDGDILDSQFIFCDNKTDQKITFSINIEIIRSIDTNFLDLDSEKMLKKAKFFNKNPDLPEIFNISCIIEKNTENTALIYLNEVYLNNRIIYSNNYLRKAFPNSKNKDLINNQNIINNVLNYFNDCIQFLDSNRYFVNESISSKNKSFTPENFKSWLYELSLDNKRYSEFLDFKKSLNDFVIKDYDKPNLINNIKHYPLNNGEIGFSKLGDLIEIMLSKENKRLPISSYGTGIQQLLYIIAKIFFSKSKIIIIEELELNLSPRYQEEFIKYISELIRKKILHQIFFTTHSYYYGRISTNLNINYGFYDIFLNNDGYSQSKYINTNENRKNYLSNY